MEGVTVAQVLVQNMMLAAHLKMLFGNLSK